MELVNNQYQIQGLNLLEICQKYDTPLYLYDGNTIINKIQSFREAFSGLNLKIKYAAKALTNISILKLMQSQGIGLDVVSIQEARLGLLAGFKPEAINFTPNGVSFEEIQEAVSLGLGVNLDNISSLEKFGNTYGGSIPIGIRLNPHVMAGGNSKISVGHVDSKFGISVLQIRHILRIVKAHNLKISGLHVHTGSDILDSGVFLRVAEMIFECAREFPDLKFIDFGSGFKVAYREGDVVTDIQDLGQTLGATIQSFCVEYGHDLEIWFEPGKFLVSESGLFLAKTNVVKQTPATVFVGLDSGLNHLIRPMFYDSYHEIFNVSNTQGPARVYNVVGYICETDTFGADRKMHEVSEGDIIGFKNAGAYGFMMSSQYNSRFRPAEVLILNGKDYLIRERETMDDILRNQILVDFE
jgi:diaminopimelate decarboxylase